VTVLVPLSILAFVLFLLAYDFRLVLILMAFLFLAGVTMPWLARSLGDAPARRVVALKSDLRAAAVDGVQGLAELQAYGAAGAQATRIGDVSRQLAREQQRLSGIAGLSQGVLGLSANLAMWLVVWTTISLVHDGTLATLMAGCSVLLLITHRTEGLAEMDEIIVLEQGRVTARGDHRHLLDRLPTYRNLWGAFDE
jgi:ABC-type transport system involved in cytochrome bd biosynthesis fused ATPase/permease subunit